MSLQLMKERVKQSGSTLYNEQIKDAQDILAYGFKDDISYNPNIIIYKTETYLPIKMHSQKYSSSYGVTTSFLSPYDNPVELGQMLYDTKSNEHWLCVESYNVSGVHCEGKLGKCLRWLKWQDSNGVIQEIPIIVTSASKYNNGQEVSNAITLGSDQLLLFMQFNEDTCKLDRGQKFFIDENMESPTTYELTRIDTALYTYMGKGFISMIVTECAYTPSENDLKYGVCNYKEVDTSTLPSEPENPDETTVLSCIISGNQNLKVGFSRTYAATITDVGGNEVVWDDTYSWNVISSCDVKYDISNNKIKLSVEDEDFIDEVILLQIIKDDIVVSQIEITVVEAF